MKNLRDEARITTSSCFPRVQNKGCCGSGDCNICPDDEPQPVGTTTVERLALTDAAPLFEACKAKPGYLKYRNWLAARMPDALKMVGVAEFMDLPMEFQAGALLDFFEQNGYPVDFQYEAGIGPLDWCVSCHGETFLHDNQFIALRDLAEVVFECISADLA